jgi:hypothetical protein
MHILYQSISISTFAIPIPKHHYISLPPSPMESVAILDTDGTYHTIEFEWITPVDSPPLQLFRTDNEYTEYIIYLRIQSAVQRYRADRRAFSRITLEEALKCARMLDTFSQLPMSPYDDARTEHAPYGVDRHMIILKHIQVAVGRTRGVSDGEEGIFAEAARECVIELLRYVERYKEREVVSKAGEEEEATRREAREIARRNRAGSWALWMLRGIWSVPSCIFGVVGGICGAILGVPASLRRMLGFGR